MCQKVTKVIAVLYTALVDWRCCVVSGPKYFHLRMFSVTSAVGAKEMDDSAESSLLYAARNGDIDTVKTLVTAHKENGLLVDLNCTGMDQYIVLLRC